MPPLAFLAALTTLAAASPRAELKAAALSGAPEEQHDAIAFLIDHMPARDVAALKPEFLRRNVALAYQARNGFPWAQEIPKHIFFNDVLPYACIDEAREDWRADFLDRFREEAAKAKTLREAVTNINDALVRKTGVTYNTKRRAPNQGPLESIQLKMASCSGLSILLADALRAVGIPARLTGVALWTTTPGNHNWVEVWLPDDRQWHFIEYGGGPDDFDRGWLVGQAARAIPGSMVHGVYSTSWKREQGGPHFPIIWNLRDSSVAGVEVTARYLELGKATLPAIGECELRIEVMAAGASGSEARRPLPVVVLQGDVEIAKGTSPTPADDMNRFLTVKVKQGQIYQVVALKDGRPAAIDRVQIGGREGTRKVTLSVPG